MIVTFFYAFAAAAVLGLPADYTWRRARRLAAFVGLASAAAVVGAVAVAAHLGLLVGAGNVAALVFGLIAGGVTADAVASRTWGPAHHQY